MKAKLFLLEGELFFSCKRHSQPKEFCFRRYRISDTIIQHSSAIPLLHMTFRPPLICTILLFTVGSLYALTPIQEARNHLEHALGLLNKKEEAAGKKRKTSIPFIISVLSNTEVRLNEIKGNKGTNINAALQFVAHAKIELESAKEGAETHHLEKAETDLVEALKRVRKMAEIKKANN